MGLFGWIFYIVMGVICFFLTLFLEKKYSLSLREKLVFSLIFLLIVSGFCYRYVINITGDIFLIFVFTFVTDILYTSYFLDTDFFDKEESRTHYYVILIFLGFLMNQEFINRVTQVFLTGEDFRIIIWAFVFLFFYHFLDTKRVIKSKKHDRKFMSRNHVLEEYAKLKYRYYDECDSKDRDFSNLLYAIMIYQNHKRNKNLRKIDYFLFRINGGNKPLGIMQVKTDKYISDSESIQIIRKELEKMRYKGSKSKKVDIEEIIKDYSLEDASSIQYIFDIIKKF